MDKNQQRALVCAIAGQLRGTGSWCGATHIQKAVYVAARWLGVPEFRNFGFTLYTYGPFSFRLKEELSEMRGEGWLDDYFAPGQTYGPTLIPGERIGGSQLESRKEFNFVAEEFGAKGVVELERLTTAMLASEAKELGRDAPARERAELVRKWKKHLSEDEALQAVQNADALLTRAEAKGLLKTDENITKASI